MDPTATTTAIRRPTLRRRAALIAGIVLALAAAPALVFASHQFTDVPDGSPYHAQIGALAGAGISAGCTATTYCPKSTVTREQMAAFLNRGLGYSVANVNYVTASEADADFVTEVTIPARAQAGGTAYVEVTATVNVWDGSDSCPCGVYAFVVHDPDSKGSEISPLTTFMVPAALEGGAAAEGTVTWVFEVPTGAPATFGLAAFMFPLSPEPAPAGPGTDGDLPGEPEIQGALVAEYSPFGSTVESEGFPLSLPDGPEIQERLDRILSR